MVLLALLRLGPDAYGVTIRAEIVQRTGRSITPGTIYPTLERLERKGWVTSRVGEPRAERGGRARRHFELTAVGLQALRDAWHQLSALAEGLEGALDGES